MNFDFGKSGVKRVLVLIMSSELSEVRRKKAQTRIRA